MALKKSIIVLALLFSKISSAQDSISRFEFGSTILTVNSFCFGQPQNLFFYYDTGLRPPVEIINGLFFRYTKKRLALRAHASYSDFSSANSYTTESYPFGPTGGNFRNRDFRIGAGGQFSFLARHPWIYAFLDIAYRHVEAAGNSFGLWPARKYTSASNGADGFVGLGVKIKIARNFNLSPEIGCNNSIQFVRGESIATEPFMFWNPPHKYSYWDFTAMPILKLHFTVRF